MSDVFGALPPGERLPAVLVDLAAFDRNVARVAELARAARKTVRLATKSVRVPALLDRALKSDPGVFQGLMCFCAEEAAYLASLGHDDLLVAYPTLSPPDLVALARLHAAGTRVALVVDDPAQVRALAAATRDAAAPFGCVIDQDMSLRWFGGRIHLGVRRSRVRRADEVVALAREIARHPTLRVAGLLAYEAQVAGLGDRNPFKRLLNPAFALVRRLSVRAVARARAEAVRALRDAGFAPEIVNGGGTGSLDFACAEACLTEVTVGSALLCSHLFDYYSNLKFEPACWFALQATRHSDPGYVTCLGGGFVASGEPGWDKVPRPVFPAGLSLTADEACGEVQTPLRGSGGGEIALGAAVFFRHAKAGELAERFAEYLCVEAGRIAERAKTYRGFGRTFF